MKQRLHKILASAGIASLRKSERLIAEGRIQVNGQTAKIGDFADQNIDVILDDTDENFSSKINIAITAPMIGIKCKKIPALLAPIIEIPFIQKKNAAKPGKITTYAKIK